MRRRPRRIEITRTLLKVMIFIKSQCKLFNNHMIMSIVNLMGA
jgi:hypothetical protein